MNWVLKFNVVKFITFFFIPWSYRYFPLLSSKSFIDFAFTFRHTWNWFLSTVLGRGPICFFSLWKPNCPHIVFRKIIFLTAMLCYLCDVLSVCIYCGLFPFAFDSQLNFIIVWERTLHDFSHLETLKILFYG